MRYHGLIDAFWLKMAMLALMLMDHLYYFLFPSELIFWHYAARVVAPVFAYLLAVGMVHTRDRVRYILRLYAAGVIMALGNTLIYYVTKIEVPNNIFLSLAVAASLIFCKDKLREGSDRILWLFLCVALAIASLFCEGQFLVPLMAVIFYYLRANPPVMCAVYVIATGSLFISEYLRTSSMPAQFFMVLAVIPIMLYNGRRGPDTALAKYFFYAFYPLHVWAIVLVKAFTPL